MSFNTVATISAITEFVVISAIVLILLDAFSHHRLFGFTNRLLGRASEAEPEAVGHDYTIAPADHDHGEFKHAA